MARSSFESLTTAIYILPARDPLHKHHMQLPWIPHRGMRCSDIYSKFYQSILGHTQSRWCTESNTWNLKKVAINCRPKLLIKAISLEYSTCICITKAKTHHRSWEYFTTVDVELNKNDKQLQENPILREYTRNEFSPQIRIRGLRSWTAFEYVLLKFPHFHLIWRELTTETGMKDLSIYKD